MTGLSIRPYLETDTEGVVTFFTESSQLDSTIEPVSTTGWEYFTSRPFNNNAKDFAIAEQDGKVIGLLTSLRKIDDILGPIRHFRIIVHPNHRREKVATELLRTLDLQDTAPILRQCNILGKWKAGVVFLKNNGYEIAHSELLMSLGHPIKREIILPDEITIRPHQEKDNAWWAELSNTVYRGNMNAILQTPDSVASESRAEGFQLWTISIAGKPVGFSHSIASETNGLLNSIVIDPAYQGKGLAKPLMAASINTMIDQGCTAIELNVDSDNAPAIGLYLSFGFAEYDSMNLYRRHE
jgi:ribosomal protein S18 acetylase RimI-like enzyme